MSTDAVDGTDVFQRMPKVELHVHLDCCLSLDAVTKLAPGTDRASFFRRYVGPARCASLADFLRYIDASLELLQTRDGLRVAVDDLFAQFARDNVLCAEIRFAPLIHLRQGLTAEDVVRTVAHAVGSSVARTGIEARLILCALRHFSAEESLASTDASTARSAGARASSAGAASTPSRLRSWTRPRGPRSRRASRRAAGSSRTRRGRDSWCRGRCPSAPRGCRADTR